MTPVQRVGRATVDVLAVLLDSTRPRWGLEIIKATGRPSGSVYPLLDRLERAGWLSSHWDDSERRGPRRRLYQLTAQGATEAHRICAAQQASTAAAARRTARGVGGRPQAAQ